MKKQIFTLALFSALASPGASLAGNIYVSPNGDDAAKGTVSEPLKTVEAALKQAREWRRLGSAEAEGGINDTLLELLGLQKLGRGDDGFLTFAKLSQPVALTGFVKHVADTLQVHGIRWAGSERMVQKVALCSGAGDNEFVSAAQAWGADVYLTGDMKYHEMLDAAENGFAVIAAGHYETEYLPAVTALRKMTAIFSDVQFLTFDQPNPIQTV